MTLHLKYFGIIAERTQKESEIFDSTGILNLEDLKEALCKKYPLDNISFQFAINKKMKEDASSLKNEDEVAILPPFAGG